MKPLINNILSFFHRSLQPVRVFFNPLTSKVNTFLLPLKKSWRKYADKNPRESRIFKWFFLIIGGGISFFFMLVILVSLGLFGKMPSKKELKNIETANASEVYSSDGIVLGKYYTENRTTIDLDSISPYLITALLAIEDKRFFEHSGIDLRSWLRVFKGMATNKQNLGGGSTLSQQLAKNLYRRKNYFIPGFSLLINKIRENITSMRLENIYNKEELLTLYLNTVPFGGNRFGIQEASRYFYNKRPRKLNPDEAATLIGMLKATTALDPTRNPENSKERRNLVLKQMLKNKDFRFDSKEMATISKMINTGSINEEQYEKLINTPITAKPHEDYGNNDGPAPYFREYLRTKELPRILKNIQKDDGKNFNIYTDGLKIYTTIDSRLQKHAEEAVYKHMSYIQKEFKKHWKGVKDEKPWGDDKWIDEQVKKSDRYKTYVDEGKSKNQIDSLFSTPVPMTIFSWTDKPSVSDTMLTPLDSVRYYFTLLNTGFMALDQSNGYIKSWVGGTDFTQFKYDHILSKRQVGSTFKPIVYAAALADSIKACTYFHNIEVTIEDWSPKNSDNRYGGYYSLTGGLAYSENVIAAKLIEKVGIQKTIDMATKLGVKSKLPREFGISLGATEISLLEMMEVYATMANYGYKTEPVAIIKIEDRYGNVIYDYEKMDKKDPVQVLDSTIAYTMTRMMQNVITYGTANALKSQFCRHCDFAGKTGTTQNHSDGWFIGYNPKLLTGVWVGGPSPAVRFRSMNFGSGAALALPVAGHFWYKVSIDPKFASLTQEEFPRNEKIIEQMACPLKLWFSPDKYYAVMKDSTLKDSLLKTGFRDLRSMVDELFPEDTAAQEISELELEEVNDVPPVEKPAIPEKKPKESAKLPEKPKKEEKPKEGQKKVNN
ncbi:MAG: transglycosylase domain-containing protein [Saprospiraceae bacterium]|nr:transglycosylase domain-containing protein [Saprospiraceae bacterium]MBK8371507.1 transglycosylase domain-containing protein [Saprospiraceae bacterium]MBK8548772.1 transglycosylase domain-containing protein [Saprospiraceae bacterium]MBK8853645.1 transglycosylase domain-containing protein [Saprospiraceae bacterium]MBP6694912.1 transglycosylase domain-containing protein [Saprospiraceae bacterium]